MDPFSECVIEPAEQLTNWSRAPGHFFLIMFALAILVLPAQVRAGKEIADGSNSERNQFLASLTSINEHTAQSDASSRNRRVWSRHYDGSAHTLDLAQAVAINPDGTMVFVTGLTNGVGDGQYATIAYRATTGRKIWQSLYNGSPCTDAAIALAVSPDGTKVFVTGSSGCLGLEDYATVAYDATNGSELWVARYNGPTGDPDEAYAVAVSPDATTVFVTGRSFGVLGEGRDYATVAYDAVTGQELWTSRYDGPAHGEERSNDEAYALAVTPDGTKIVVTGVSAGVGSLSDYTTVAYDTTTGNQLWLSRYNGPANADDFAQAAAVSHDGSKVFVTGYSYGSNTFSDYTTLAYDVVTGTELWARRYDDPAHGYDFAYALAVSPDGTKVFVTGSSDGPDFTISDYATQAYDASNGKQLWLQRYNGPGNSTDSASAIAVSPDGGKVFVTGISSGLDTDFPFDFATVAYDATTGHALWQDRFNGPAHLSDWPYDLTVSPDGTKVFVTGSSDAVNSGTNYLTLAYADGATLN